MVGQTWARQCAFAGAVVWLLLLFTRIAGAQETELISRLLLLGVLVIVPLGLSLISDLNNRGQSRPNQFPMNMQPVGAAAIVISIFLSEGFAAAALASVWLMVTGLIALFGLLRLLRASVTSETDLCIAAGLVYLPIGGVWLIASRLGIQPFGFGDTIVLLTAVHFHFAGFAAPILAGLAGNALPTNGIVNSAFRVAAIGIVAGTPLVAGGITFSPVLALAGAIVVSVGLIVLSALVIGWVVPSLPSASAQALLIISSVATLPAMVLACAYAYSIVFNRLIIDIPQMAMTHGIANAFGFALCGLVGWSIVKPRERSIQA
jgi:YndJ-like protein